LKYWIRNIANYNDLFQFLTKARRGHFDVAVVGANGPPDGVRVAEGLVDGQLQGRQLAAHNLLHLHRQVLGQQGLRPPYDAPSVEFQNMKLGKNTLS